MLSRVPWWAVLSDGAVVFIGCGIFFAFQSLGTANDYASIASFFVALLTAAGSLFSLVRSKQEKAARAQSERDRRTGSRSLLLAWKTTGIVNRGDNARFEDIHIGALPPQEEEEKQEESG